MYTILPTILLLLAAASTICTYYIPWYAGFIDLAVIWFIATLIGRKRAFSSYRKIMRETLEFTDFETTESMMTKEDLIRETKRSDNELYEQLKNLKKSDF